MLYMLPGYDGMLAQIRKGVLDYCVLARLARGSAYGHEIAQTLGESGLFGSQGSLYPLLARIRKKGWADTIWEESPRGAPRRYYTLTAAGTKRLQAFIQVWRSFSHAVDQELEDL